MEYKRKLFFERNLLALSTRNPVLCSRFTNAETTHGHYKFLESRTGEIVPALVDITGAAHPLHSLVDPRREAERLVSTIENTGFIILLGLGGGFAAEAALARTGTSKVVVIDYNADGTAELFCSREYIKILHDPRFILLIDPRPEDITKTILENYQPVLSGGIRALPLRTRTERENRFTEAGETIHDAIGRMSADYSVQAYFGMRWFSNIIRNIKTAENQEGAARPIRHAAICAAGPSLDTQIPLLAKNIERNKKNLYIIAADTSLPSLLKRDIIPDAVVSIDCQHISYYHFMAGIPPNTQLFMDLAGPPLVASRSPCPRFFSGGHPFSNYISEYWRAIPRIDSSGGNVTYTALGIAENLGAETIDIYGADFSYPMGKSYARGTYIYPFFEKQQNRFSSLEALHSRFLYRNYPLAKTRGNSGWYYETETLSFYRARLEEKIALMRVRVNAVSGSGAPIRVEKKQQRAERDLRFFSSGPVHGGWKTFLREYKSAVNKFPRLQEDSGNIVETLSEKERLILATLLPLAAAIKHRHKELKIPRLIEEVRGWCAAEINKIL
jgi:hypothetical protein